MHHGDKAERGRQRKRERVSLSLICAVALCAVASLSLLPVQHRPWQGVSHGDLFGLRKTGSPQTFAKDREIEG